MSQLRQSVQLCNGQTGLRTLLAAEVKVLSREDGIVRYIASDETIDSYREIVRADGWNFDLFQKNSPFVDTHDYSSIGKLLGSVIGWQVDKRNRQLIEDVKWAKDVEKNTVAQLGWQMLIAGFGPKAVSVGFMPVSYVTKWDNDPGPWREQLSDLGIHEEDGVRCIYTQQQQIELSACILGANPNALQMARKALNAGVISRREFNFLESGRTSPQFQVPFDPKPSTKSSMSKQALSRLHHIAGKFDSSASVDNELYRAQRNGSESDVQSALRTLRLTDGMESRAALRDPIQRILSNPERRMQLNALARKLMKIKLTSAQEQCLKAMSEESGFGTSYIADDFAQDIYDLLAINGAWATLGVKPIYSKKGKFATIKSYPNAQFVLQGVALEEDSAFDGESFLSDTATIACLVGCTLQMLQDGEVDISELLLENFTEAFNQRLDTAVFIGSGVADGDNGGVTGMFVDTNISDAVSGAGHTTLESCNRDDFLSVISTVSANALQRPCRWWVSSALLPKLMKCKDDAGRPLVTRPAGSKDFYLLEFPITLVPVAPADNSAGKRVMAFGDPRAYTVAIRNWFNFEASSDYGWNVLKRNFRAYGNATGKLRKKEGLAMLKLAAV